MDQKDQDKRIDYVEFRAVDLEQVKDAVLAAGAVLTTDLFEFPGGRRFHFRDPAGNERAVWSDDAPA